MGVEFILDNLYRKFDRHKYALNNSYIYDWESDYFSITNDGYAQEVEIKTSYSDFKADFKKTNKHKTLSQKYNSEEFKTRFVNRIYELTYPERNIGGGRRHRLSQPVTAKRKNGSDEKYWRKNGIEYKWTSSEITYDTSDICPNKFYYICPKDIIPKEEVPEYAGLYCIYESGRIVTKKRAPFIHKEKQDLNGVLLDKFYYLCLKLQNKL